MVLQRACHLRLADVVVYGSVGKTCESSSCWEQSLALLPAACLEARWISKMSQPCDAGQG